MLKKFFLFLVPLSLFVASCDEKESNIGFNLQDPATLYDGVLDSSYCRAVTLFRDSLYTSGRSNTLVGFYSDPSFGSSEAIFYSRLTTPDNSGVSFDENCHLDSAVLSLYISSLYPSDTSVSSYSLHFEVYQLQEAVADTSHLCTEQMPVSDVLFFDSVVTIIRGDTMIADLKLNDNFLSIIRNRSFQSSDEFVNAMKGVRIRLLNDGAPIMANINLAASATRVTLAYKYQSDTSLMDRTYEFTIGHSVPHFTQFTNHYLGPLAVFNNGTADSIAGSQYLYLIPMGGTNVRLDFNAFVEQFSSQHPFAIIHYAELILPVASVSPSDHPSQLSAWKYDAKDSSYSIPDVVDLYTYNGFDGKYDEEHGYYRLRVTQHLQKLLRQGKDYGTLLTLSTQLSSPERLVLNGYDNASTMGNAVRLRFVYSE